MEWIISFLLAFLVFSAVLQLFWGYALSTIAQKGGQSDLMQVLAWIPLLQIAPMVVAGGGSVQAFVMGALGLLVGTVVLGIASAFVGGTVGAAIVGLASLFMVLLCLVYFGRLCWTMAVERDLSGWVGLLLFVPVVNFFVYPYIAFHDGWTAPNKVGLVIGLVVAFGSTAPSFQTVRLLQQEGALPPELIALLSGELSMEDFAELQKMQQMQQGMPGSAPSYDPGAATMNADGIAVDPAASIRALYSMQERFERLRLQIDSPQIANPNQQQVALVLVRSIEQELMAHRAVIDGQTFQQLATDLVEAEARIHAAGGGSPDSTPRIALAESSDRNAPSGATGSPGPAAYAYGAVSDAPPLRPFPVQPTDGCPQGTELRTRSGDKGDEEWCQQRAELGGLRHGWYARYLEGGRPESMGEYAHGLRIGVWTRFYPSGRVRAQAEFAAGLQHGWLLSFDEDGERTQAVRFDQGVALR